MDVRKRMGYKASNSRYVKGYDKEEKSIAPILSAMDAKIIQRYKSRSIPWLRKKAKEYFHAYIRLRDADKPCITCNNWRVLECGHFYSAGKFPELEFNEFNSHGQCKQCNRHEHGNLNMYRRNIVNRIPADALTLLDNTADYFRKVQYKHDRFTLIEIIETYKQKCKEF